MRELTLLLVLANLAFLAWGLWIAPEETARSAPPSAAQDHVERLVLASEAESGAVDLRPAQSGAALPNGDESTPASGTGGGGTEPDQASASVEQTASSGEAPAWDSGTAAPYESNATTEPGTQTVAMLAPATTPSCVSVGPFLDLAETAEAAARLREKGYVPQQRLADSPVWMGHWVYLSPFATRAEATAAVEKLRDQGVQDLYIEAGGEDENAVSLGLYSDRERAEALASDIRQLGYAPEIGDRYRVATVYWVDVVLPANARLVPAEFQTRPGRIVREEERECPAGTVAPTFVNTDEQD
jgi:hypothetical protein